MLASTTGIDGSELLKILISAFFGGVSGYATALFTFKLKVAMLERDLADHKAEVALKMDTHTRLLERVDRRQMITLEALYDIASAISEKLGVTNKGGSLLMKFIQESATEP